MIKIIDAEENVCNWIKTDTAIGQEFFQTSCGATTSALSGVVHSYRWCPFCGAKIKIVKGDGHGRI